MSHPHKSEVASSHTAKMRRMTRDYGEANPAMNIKTPAEKMKIEGPEASVGFGAMDGAATSRSDKPARRSVAANPVPTYKRGGKADMCSGGVATRARGGRLGHKGHKGSTHVNVVVAPQGGAGAPPAMAPPPQLAALAAKPPMAGPPPAMPPAGGPPMGGPPEAPPPMMRKRGGKVDASPIKEELKDEGLTRRSRGGHVPDMPGGSISGPGREAKNESWKKHGDKGKQAV